MSVKFKETVQTNLQNAANAPGSIAHEIGAAVTRGGGPQGYLAQYMKQLQAYPIRTKMITSATLSSLQELLATVLAQDPDKNGNYFTSRVPKMALYGGLISAPMAHVLTSWLQWIFAGRTSVRAKVLQIVVSNLLIAPIQNSVYLGSMAIIAGARRWHQVQATWKAGFMPIMKFTWVISPLSLAFAQQFLPQETWVPFFNFVAFVLGTYVNTTTKMKRLKALRQKREQEGRPPPPGTY